jgi:hypothetical protein
MCYKDAIASAGGEKATLAKSLIIYLEDAVTNWYSRLPPGCIYSWQQLKEKFLLNFQGFQAELNMKEDFLSFKRNAPQFLPEIPATEGPSSESIRRTSHRSSYQGLARGALAQPSYQRVA